MEIKITCSMEQEHGLIYKGFYIGYSCRDACDVTGPCDTLSNFKTSFYMIGAMI